MSSASLSTLPGWYGYRNACMHLETVTRKLDVKERCIYNQLQISWLITYMVRLTFYLYDFFWSESRLKRIRSSSIPRYPESRIYHFIALTFRLPVSYPMHNGGSGFTLYRLSYLFPDCVEFRHNDIHGHRLHVLVVLELFSNSLRCRMPPWFVNL